MSSLLRASVTCIRLFYKDPDDATSSSYFHTFHLTSTRLFNNIAIRIRNDDEAKGLLQCMVDGVSMYSDDIVCVCVAHFSLVMLDDAVRIL